MSMEHLPACPCNVNVSKSDGRFIMDIYNSLIGSGDAYCIRTIFVEGGDQQCCYGHTGELLPYAKGGGSVSRFSATHQPLLYMLRDFWPRIMCDQLANKTSVTQQLRPTDDCSGYVPPMQGAWNCGFK
ncbi:hypothetical protein NP493_2345g00017 [Ridgeia piscesae]|uniref:AMOP domain-containing protein n=1 Tax=Ridgeia piscesae TaxID=27915 RepID=A0AAD9JHK5_RIDPI|nr:hypothetical protein NP493_2345g00016 [Ridgeia piscesae]KAK2153236.1 hypothetical protein NP493_2345g00015 [Ridgeia piscesae]KAK2153237.1 hypothetical protein NP493_2345g00017 [Ridgeia piscesae]